LALDGRVDRGQVGLDVARVARLPGVAGNGRRVGFRRRGRRAGVAGVGRGRLRPRRARVARAGDRALGERGAAAGAAVGLDLGDGVATHDAAECDVGVGAAGEDGAGGAAGVAAVAGRGAVEVAAPAAGAADGRARDVVAGRAGVARERSGVAGGAAVGQRGGHAVGPGVARAPRAPGVPGTDVDAAAGGAGILSDGTGYDVVVATTATTTTAAAAAAAAADGDLALQAGVDGGQVGLDPPAVARGAGVPGDRQRVGDRRRGGGAGVAGVGRRGLRPRQAGVDGDRLRALNEGGIAAGAAVGLDLSDGVAAPDVAEVDGGVGPAGGDVAGSGTAAEAACG